MKKKKFLLLPVVAIVVAAVAFIPNAFADDVNISYQAHVQNIGWQSVVSDGEMAGTSGQGLRVEALKVDLDTDLDDVSIMYRAHVQNIGWQDWKSDGEIAGTEGQGLRVEALQIIAPGLADAGYVIKYRAHVQNIGWQNWVTAGETTTTSSYAGTSGQGLRVEAIEIKVEKTADKALADAKTAAIAELKAFAKETAFSTKLTDNTKANASGTDVKDALDNATSTSTKEQIEDATSVEEVEEIVNDIETAAIEALRSSLANDLAQYADGTVVNNYGIYAEDYEEAAAAIAEAEDETAVVAAYKLGLSAREKDTTILKQAKAVIDAYVDSTQLKNKVLLIDSTKNVAKRATANTRKYKNETDIATAITTNGKNTITVTNVNEVEGQVEAIKAAILEAVKTYATGELSNYQDPDNTGYYFDEAELETVSAAIDSAEAIDDVIEAYESILPNRLNAFEEDLATYKEKAKDDFAEAYPASDYTINATDYEKLIAEFEKKVDAIKMTTPYSSANLTAATETLTSVRTTDKSVADVVDTYTKKLTNTTPTVKSNSAEKDAAKLEITGPLTGGKTAYIEKTYIVSGTAYGLSDNTNSTITYGDDKTKKYAEVEEIASAITEATELLDSEDITTKDELATALKEAKASILEATRLYAINYVTDTLYNEGARDTAGHYLTAAEKDSYVEKLNATGLTNEGKIIKICKDAEAKYTGNIYTTVANNLISSIEEVLDGSQLDKVAVDGTNQPTEEDDKYIELLVSELGYDSLASYKAEIEANINGADDADAATAYANETKEAILSTIKSILTSYLEEAGSDSKRFASASTVTSAITAINNVTNYKQINANIVKKYIDTMSKYKYKVTFMNDETVVDTKYADSSSKVALTTKSVTAPTGMEFKKVWKVADEDGEATTTTYDPTVKLTEDLVVIASFDDKTYTVTYKQVVAGKTTTVTFMDGADKKYAEYVHGTGLTLPKASDYTDYASSDIPDGYTFAGWYTNTTYETEVESITDEDAANITLYAKWEANELKLTFDAQGGTSVDSVEYSVNGKDIVLTGDDFATVQDNHEFKGWYTQSTGGTKVTTFDVSANPTGATLYAQWEGAKYSVTLNANGGTITDGKNVTSYTYGEASSITLPTASEITKTGYTLEGWYTDATLETAASAPAISNTDNGAKTFYAKWTPVTATITLDASSDSNAAIDVSAGKFTTSSGTTSGTYTYDSSLPLPNVTTTTSGKTFKGWNTAANGTGTPVTDVNVLKPTADTILYAIFE